MKERWQELDRGRKIIILLQPVMFILFLIIFLSIGHHQVISYRSGYLRYERQEDAVLCSGRVDGHDLQYVVTAGSVVEFWLDGALDSTYTITDDPTAVPQAERTEYPRQDYLTGVEIQKDGQVWFRGAYSPYSDYWLVAEDGTNLSYDIVVNRPEPAPTPGVILYIAGNPETSPGDTGRGCFSACCSALPVSSPSCWKTNFSTFRCPFGCRTPMAPNRRTGSFFPAGSAGSSSPVWR